MIPDALQSLLTLGMPHHDKLPAIASMYEGVLELRQRSGIWQQ